MSSSQSLTDPTNDADRVRVASPVRVHVLTDVSTTDPHEAVGEAAGVVRECFSFALYLFSRNAASSFLSQTQAPCIRTNAEARQGAIGAHPSRARSAQEESSHCSFSLLL